MEKQTNIELIIYGQPKTCIPCRLTEENVNQLVSQKLLDLKVTEITDIEVIRNKGFNAVPVIEMVFPNRTIALTDTSIMLDEEELENWINERLGEL